MAVSTYLDQIQQLYIAYFGRPADPVGLTYWATQVDAANGSVASVIAGFSTSSESNALYSGVSTSQKISSIYLNLFNRQPEASGLAYWVAQIESGAVSQAQAAYQIQSNAGAGDAAAVANKLAAANAFTSQIDTAAEIAGYAGANAAASSRAFLAQVDSTAYGLSLGTTGATAAVANASGTTQVVAPVTPVAPPFSVTENAVSHVLEFSGTASGTITMSMPDATHAIFSQGSNVSNSLSLTTVKGINVPTDSISITATQAANLATANVAQKIVFDAGDAITITGIASLDESAALTSFTKANVGGSNVTLVATDGAWSMAASNLTTALAAGEKLSGALTVTDIASADEIAALTSFTSDATGASSVKLMATDGTWQLTEGQLNLALAGPRIKVDGTLTVSVSSITEFAAIDSFTSAWTGADHIILDANDNTWVMSAAALDVASTGGITLAANDVVTITNTLAQGLKTVALGTFQSGNDKLQFSAANLSSASGFVSSTTGAITVGGSKVELVVGTGGALVASAAEAAFLFDTATGKLSFDADGTGSAASAIDVVTLTGVNNIVATDFVIA